MKKNIIIAITALLACAPGAWAQDTPSLSDLEKDGSTYLISSAADLNTLATYVNSGGVTYDKDTKKSLTFKVTQDITFGESDTFIPIGKGDETDGKAFSGEFDGGGFTISGINYSDPEGVGIGLFGYIYNPAVIKNVKLENCSFTGNYEVGAIVGWNAGYDEDNGWVGISNCTVGSNVTVTAATATIEGDEIPGTFAGGIIGACTYMTVENCISAATVTGDELVGGITGRLLSLTDGDELGVIDNCYFTGTRTEGSTSDKNAIGKRGPSDYDSEGTGKGLVRITLYADDSSEDINNTTRLENYSGQTCDVTIGGLTLKKDGNWHTICLPFHLTNYLEDTNCPFYGAAIMTMPNETSSSTLTDGTLTLNFKQETSNTTAYTAYLVKWASASNITDPVFKNVYVTYSNTSASVEGTTADFLGIKTTKSFEANDRTVLLLNDDEQKLYYPTEATTLKTFNAYFKLNGDLKAATEDGVKVYKLMYGDEELITGEFEVSTPTTPKLTLTDNADNSSAIADANGKVYDVTLSGRTLYKDGSWNTLCLPFAVAEITGTPLEGATVKTLSGSSFSSGKLTLNFSSDNLTALEAGKPYIVKWEKASDYSDDNEHNLYQPTFTGVTISNTTADITTDNIDFKGCYAPVALTAGDKTTLYMGSDNKLYYPNASFNINAFRGYFTLKGEAATAIQANAANTIVLNFNDDTTGVTTPLSPWRGVGGEAFTLDGRRLNGQPTAKGIYIINGKKVVIK